MSKMLVVGSHGALQGCPKVDFATLKHRADVRPAQRLDDLQFDLRIARGVLVPKLRDDTFDELRGGRNS